MWTTDGKRAAEVHELLPRGGVILLVNPRCDVCIGSALELQQAIVSVKSLAIDAFLLTDQMQGSAEFQRALASRAIDLPVYSDLEEAFRREYRVTANPAFLMVNERGIVTKIGAGVPGESQLAEIFVSN